MTTYTEFVKQEVMDYFAETKADSGHAFNYHAFFHSRIVNWNPKQKDAFEEAINELISEGLIEKNGNSLSLTEKGVEKIYPDPGSSIRDAILDFFAKCNARTGHAFNSKAFFHQVMIHWNPKQKKGYDPAMSELLKAGLVEEKDGIILLTKKGYDHIY